MDFGIEGKTAVVLGAGGGLGRAIAVALAAEKVNVALCDVDPVGLKETSTAVQAAGGKSHAEIWNLLDIDSIEGHIRTIEEALGPVDILINNTGGPPRLQQQARPRRAGQDTSSPWSFR
jgi:3-oxoacyl-[acyl-carrier protein] reductase